MHEAVVASVASSLVAGSRGSASRAGQGPVGRKPRGGCVARSAGKAAPCGRARGRGDRPRWQAGGGRTGRRRQGRKHGRAPHHEDRRRWPVPFALAQNRGRPLGRARRGQGPRAGAARAGVPRHVALDSVAQGTGPRRHRTRRQRQSAAGRSHRGGARPGPALLPPVGPIGRRRLRAHRPRGPLSPRGPRERAARGLGPCPALWPRPAAQSAARRLGGVPVVPGRVDQRDGPRARCPARRGRRPRGAEARPLGFRASGRRDHRRARPLHPRRGRAGQLPAGRPPSGPCSRHGGGDGRASDRRAGRDRTRSRGPGPRAPGLGARPAFGRQGVGRRAVRTSRHLATRRGPPRRHRSGRSFRHRPPSSRIARARGARPRLRKAPRRVRGRCTCHVRRPRRDRTRSRARDRGQGPEAAAAARSRMRPSAAT